MNMKNVKQKILRFLGIVIMVCGVVSGSVEEGEGWGLYMHKKPLPDTVIPIFGDVTAPTLGQWPFSSGSMMADIHHILRRRPFNKDRFAYLTHDSVLAAEFTKNMFERAVDKCGEGFTGGWLLHKCSDMSYVHSYLPDAGRHKYTILGVEVTVGEIPPKGWKNLLFYGVNDLKAIIKAKGNPVDLTLDFIDVFG
jgi:hypothetical protein